MNDNNKKVKREFGISSFAIDNRTSVMILTFLIVVTGIYSYVSMPKENFPEITIPKIFVGVVYPGNSPLDMENLVTRHIEKELNSITGVTKIQSTAVQDYSTTVVEFDFDVDVKEALQKVKDAVDKAKSELPSDLDQEPNVFELDFSEIPVININISGDRFTLEQLKEYGEYLEDEIEAIPEISKVELRGSLDKEMKINVDKNKMEILQISFRDIEDAINYENTTMSAGDLLVGEGRRSIRITGEFSSVADIENIIIKNDFQQTVYLKNIATVEFAEKEADSYANIYGKPVISLDIMKRGGENLIVAVDKIKEIVVKAEESKFPQDLEVKITNDTSRQTKLQVENLENSIISGVILVVLVLLFFLGLRNALFVGVAIPLSMVMGFLILYAMDITLNIMVLFSLVLALGMLVDNGIVVVENIYRLMQEGKDPVTASKEGVGEVAIPIIASTATTLAAFIPLIFWGDIMGEFMKYLPITLIIVLSSSLFVALVINPVLTSFLMKVEDLNAKSKKRGLVFWIIMITLLVIGVLLIITGLSVESSFITGFGSVFTAIAVITLVNIYVLSPLAKVFQLKVLPLLENGYESIMKWALGGVTPIILFASMFVLLFGSISYFILNAPDVVFFPEGKPNYVNVFIELPTGTDIEKTNKIAKEVEAKIIVAMEKHGTQVESILTNVGAGTSDPNAGGTPEQGASPNKAKLTVSFVSFQERTTLDTEEALAEIREIVGDIPGAIVSVAKEPNGPPVGPPISIMISGEEFETLYKVHDEVRTMIFNSGIQGIEELKSDLDQGKPELIVEVNRDAARTYGLSTIQIAGALRTALFGKEISQYKEGDEDYPIMLRLKEDQRYDLEALKNMEITFRDQADGKIKQVPIAAVASVEYGSTLGSVNRTDLDRVVMLHSNVLDGYTANAIIADLTVLFEDLDLPEGYTVKFAGEQEQQAESMAFLLKALAISVCVIFLIIVAQFNSVMTPFIIMFSVLFSTIGVFLGIGIFGDQFVVIMTMIGIISLAGVVVNNAIVLIDYTELTRDRMRAEKGYTGKRMPKELIMEAIIIGGKTRLRPVLLTAITTVLGLIPLALGININFFGLFTHLNAEFYMGGDNAAMWGPLSWTVIYGLTFATFLTLVIVPVMILLVDRISYRIYGILGKE